jgi:hypothetical protein
MTYYDPFLASYLQGTAGQAQAALSVVLTKEINATLSSDFASQHFRIADVATAFDVYTPLTTTVTTSMGPLPVAVADTCALTWMCAPAPLGPNVHANAAGYQRIAQVFAAKL